MKRHRGGRFDIRFLARALAVAGTALAVSVCGEQGSFGGTTGPGADATPPVVQIILPTDTLIEIADSLKFTVNATDNTKLKVAHVSVTGLGTFALAVTKDTTFAVGTTVTMYTQAFVVPLPTNAAGQRIAINATATDGNDNVTTHTDTVRVNDAQAPVVTMRSPSRDTTVGSGDTLRVLAQATDPSGVRYLGARLFVRDTVLGRVQSLAVDSLVYTSRQYMRLDSFRIVVPTSLAPGNYILQAFSADSSPFFNKGASPDLAVAVRDVRPSTGSFDGPALDSQVVAGDTLPISFHATDNVGVVSVRFRGYGLSRDPLGGPPVEIPRFQPLTATLPSPRDTVIVRRLLPVFTDSTADSVLIEATLTDIGGNVSTVTRRIRVVAGPSVKLNAPATGALAPVGVPLRVIVQSYNPRGLDSAGFLSSGAIAGAGAVFKAGAPQNSVDTLALTVPATAPLATADTITPYHVRSGVRMLGRPVVVSFVDQVAPTVTLLGPTLVDTMVSAGDSLLVQFRVQDNRGVVSVTVEGFALRGDSSLGTATEVPHFGPKTVSLGSATDTTLRRYLIANSETRAEPVYIRVTAVDAAPNTTSTLRRIQVVTGASVRLLSPAIDTTHAVGNPRAVTVSGYDPDSVKVLGFVSSGAIALRDSSVYVSPLGQARTAALSLPVPGTTPLVTDTITPFVIDRLGNRTWGASVVVTFQDLTPPTLTFVGPTIDTGVVFGDSVRVTVRVRDNALGTTASLLGRAASASGQTQTWFGSVSIPGLSSVDTTVARYLPAILVDPAGALVYLVATATDAVGNSFTDSIRIQVTSGPYVRITEPTNGTQIRLGQTGARILPLVEAFNPDTILYLGYAATGRVIKTDSIATTRPLTSTTLAQQLTLVVPDTTRLGTVTLTPFVRTKSGRLTGPAVSVELIDGSLPVVRILSPARAGTDRIPAGDSLFVRVAATDDRELASLQLEGFSRRPDVWPDSLGQVTTVPRFVAKTVDLTGTVRDTVVRFLNAVLTDSTAENAYIVATATDLAGNMAVDTVRVQVIPGSYARITSPTAPAVQPIGTTMNVTIKAYDPDGISRVGFLASGAVTGGDSISYSSPPPLLTTQTTTRSLAIPATVRGTVMVTPFSVDGLGNRLVGVALPVTLSDAAKPTVSIDTPLVGVTTPFAMGDSVYVSVHVTDNIGVDSVVLAGVSRRGSVLLGTDTSVVRYQSKVIRLSPAVPDATLKRYLIPLATDSTSETVYIIATAYDSSGNREVDTASVRMVNGPTMTVVRPAAGATTSAGKSVVIELRGVDANGVRMLGWRTTGYVVDSASAFFLPVSGNLADTATFVDTLPIPLLGTGLGTFTITTFGTDSLGDVSGTVPGVTVAVQSAAGDATAPAMTFRVDRRIEVDDSVTVTATDPSGIRNLGFRVTRLDGTLLAFDSLATNLDGTLSDVARTFSMNLPDTLRYPSQVIVQGYATDNTGLLGNPGFSVVAETLTVVAGKTYSLPGGSRIGDAIFNKNRDELYLSNTAFDRIEVFDLASNSFVASIPVGSRPVGLALWPRDTLGNNADTIIVANSGGVNLSLVDVTANRREYKRYRLPDYLIQKVKTEKDPATGLLRLTITEYDYSDRPQYVAAACRSAGSPTGCGNVLALYSTTPTGAQVGYQNRGYLAWENLTRTAVDSVKGHFFWEPATASLTLTTDTLQVISVRDSVPGVPVRDTLLGAGVGQIADFGQLQFEDSTFVRNSGNYLRALVGEGGGSVAFARALSFDASAGTTVISGNPADSICIAGILNCKGVQDLGVSAALYVRDFVVNRASRVSSIAINFNGRTMLVRADSIYAFDLTLKQTGMMQVSGAAVGMDFHPSNDFDANTRGTGGFGGTGSPNNRMVFAARPDSSIDVFDTFFYGQVTDTTALGTPIPVPMRNALIGPVRAATYAGKTVLFGVTAYGLVKVQLPSITNSLFPVAPLPIVNQRPAGGNPRVRGTSPPNE